MKQRLGVEGRVCSFRQFSPEHVADTALVPEEGGDFPHATVHCPRKDLQ